MIFSGKMVWSGRFLDCFVAGPRCFCPPGGNCSVAARVVRVPVAAYDSDATTTRNALEKAAPRLW